MIETPTGRHSPKDLTVEVEDNKSEIQGHMGLVSNHPSSSEAPVFASQLPNLRRRAAVIGSLVTRFVEDKHAASQKGGMN